MNEKGLKTLEYDKVKNMLLAYATTEMGKNMVFELAPSSDCEWIEQALDETKDGADILRLKGGIPIPKLESVKKHLKRLDIGASLSAKELAETGRVLRVTNETKRFFRDLEADEIELNHLYDEADMLETLPDVSRRLLMSIENDGHVTDEASSLLASLRRQITTTEGEIRNRLGNFVRGKSSKYLSDSLVTIRNERYVIPVKAEYKNAFGGIVHDQSSSGQTLFIEPKEIVELNNRLRQQQIAEKEEIKRILEELSELIAPYTEEIENNAKILGKFDFINAKAKLAHDLKATQPLISRENDVYLRQVWHPLLDSKKAVRNDVAIGKDYQAIVITGPNTGGKTITLKTLGLVSMMGQSGMFIPAFENSRIGVFDDIFADIGDEQSIEQSLSTFSSHMTNTVEILKRIDERSLVLFDELGAGTDPQEGAALAIAILDAVGAKGSYVVATTHYPELKAYGYERPQTINASMEFDAETLKPTYHLLIGIPGRSNAFDISKRLGLDDAIVEAARQLTDQDSQDLNEMIADLVQKRHEAEEEKARFKKYLDESEKLHADLEKGYGTYVRERDNMIETAKRKANEIIENAQKKSGEIISELHKMKQSGASSIKENELIDARSRLNDLEQPIMLKKNKVLQRAKKQQEFHENDDVLVKTYGQRGVLTKRLGKHEWEVQLGILKMKIDEDDLEKIKVEENNRRGAGTVLKSSGSSHVSPQLDLRGQRYEEAMVNVDRYMDAAILAGYPSVTIVHGKGTGALRQGIIKYLQQHRTVKHFEFASPSNGGNGATVVYFK